MTRNYIIMIVGAIVAIAILSGLYFNTIRNETPNGTSIPTICCQSSWSIPFHDSPYVVGVLDKFVILYNLSSDKLLGVKLNNGMVFPITGISIPSNISDYIYFKIFKVGSDFILLKCGLSGNLELKDLNTTHKLEISNCSGASVQAYSTGEHINIILSGRNYIKIYNIKINKSGEISIIYDRVFKFKDDITPYTAYVYGQRFYIAYLKVINKNEGNKALFYIGLRIYNNNGYSNVLIMKSYMPSGIGFLLSEKGIPYLYVINSTFPNNKLIIYNILGDFPKIVCKKTINSTIVFPVIINYKDFDHDNSVELLLYTSNSPSGSHVNLELLKIKQCSKAG